MTVTVTVGVGFAWAWGAARLSRGSLRGASTTTPTMSARVKPTNGRDLDGAGQVAARGVDADDLADRDAGHERLVGLGAEGDQPVAGADLGLAVEQLDAQRPVALAGGEAELAGLLQAGADGEVGVVGEERPWRCRGRRW